MKNKSKKIEARVSINGPKLRKKHYKVLGNSEEEIIKKAKRIVSSMKHLSRTVNWDCQLSNN